MRFPIPLSLAALAGTITFALAGAAFARDTVRPARPVAIPALRQVVEHYRTLTWTFERAARVHRTPTSFTYRHSVDRAYLEWTIDTWTRRASSARDVALRRVHRRLAVAIPKAPRLHSRLSTRVAYTRRLALDLRRIYPGTVTRRFAGARGKTGARPSLGSRPWTETLQVLRYGHPPIPPTLSAAFACIHHYEGPGTPTPATATTAGQMDIRFQSRYGPRLRPAVGHCGQLARLGAAQVAARAYAPGAVSTMAEHGPRLRPSSGAHFPTFQGYQGGALRRR